METTEITCPICCDEIINQHDELQGTTTNIVDLTCCNQILCKKCMYDHIISIMHEGITGDGRKAIVCPLGCGREISEATVRKSIKAQHYSYLVHVLGKNVCATPGLYPLLRYLKMTRRGRRGRILRCMATDLIIVHACAAWSFLLIYLLRSIFSPLEECILLMTMITLLPLMPCTKVILLFTYCPYEAAVFDSIFIVVIDTILSYLPEVPQSKEDDDGIDYKQILSSTQSERLDIKLYEKWSLTIGLAKCTNKIGINCPSPDCNCVWLVDKAFREKKVKHEHESSSRMLSSWLTYSPVKERSNTSTFIDAQEIYRSNRRKDNDFFNSTEQDSRKSVCPNCATEFCALCRRPWSTIVFTSTLTQQSKAKEITHSKKTCAAYAKLVPSSNDYDYTSVARAIQAKMCPGCSVRVQRIEGCNHMTCRCGMEWCYVCQCPWNISHYSCVESNGGNRQQVPTSCVIS